MANKTILITGAGGSIGKEISRQALNDQDVALVGVGGSARNVARIHQSEHSYPNLSHHA